VTIYVDHYINLAFTHLQENASKREMLKGKLVFKQFADKSGDKIAHMQTVVSFLEDLKTQRQTITYCGVKQHHQNGKAQKRIRDQQEITLITLLQAITDSQMLLHLIYDLMHQYG